jgi:hypothetical protein
LGFFFRFRLAVVAIDFIDDDDLVVDDVVDDASEEKVVISEQHWEWFVFCLITLIKVAFVVLASGHPLETPKQICFNVFRKKSSNICCCPVFHFVFRQQAAVCFC